MAATTSPEPGNEQFSLDQALNNIKIKRAEADASEAEQIRERTETAGGYYAEYFAGILENPYLTPEERVKEAEDTVFLLLNKEEIEKRLASVDALEAQIKDLEKDKSTLQADKAQLETDKSALKDVIKGLKSEKSDLEQANADLQKDLDDATNGNPPPAGNSGKKGNPSNPSPAGKPAKKGGTPPAGNPPKKGVIKSMAAKAKANFS